VETVKADPATGVSLHAITRENYRAVIRLKISAEQETFVADNVFSLAETWVEPSFQPLAIYHADEPVGFTMYGLEESTGRWWVIRLMVDARYQARGYGRAAMQLLLSLMVERHEMKQIVTSYEPGNDVAAALYRTLGFNDTGAMDEGEHLMVLDLPEPPGGKDIVEG
jgi:diamine N-acetyltransferase